MTPSRGFLDSGFGAEYEKQSSVKPELRRTLGEYQLLQHNPVGYPLVN